jgi:hypothetical protein
VRRRPLTRTLLVALALPAVALLPAASSRAVTSQGFSASAASSGIRVLYKNANDNTGTQFDVSAPVTSARVTSSPDSAGFASAPYPGDDLISLVNTLGPAVGVAPPPYPASVSSSVPGRPQQSTSLPAGYALLSTSTVTSSKATATVGAGQAGDAELATSTAISDVHTTATGVLATATSSTDSFTAGPLVVSRVRSTATAVLDASGRTTLTSSIELGQATVSGQKVGLTREGLTVAGTDVPLPAGQLTDALAAAGVSVTYLSETRTATSITAPGLAVHYKDDTQDTTFTLGRAQAGVSTDDAATPVSLPPTIGSDGAVGSGERPASQPGEPVLSGTAPAAPVGATVPSPTLGGPAPAGTPPVPAVAAAARTAQTFDSGLFYLVLVVAAAAAMAVAQSMRYLGVRWASSSR